MKDNAKRLLIQKLNSEKNSSTQILINLYNQFRKEVNANITKLGSYPKVFIYLKSVEFEFIECQNACFRKHNNAIQLELFPIEENPVKKKK